MRTKPVDVTFILDRSGSMAPRRADAIGGFNTFLKEQKEKPGACHLTLLQFDNEVDIVYAGPIAGCPELTDKTFVPRGGTALLDAVGYAIVQAEARGASKRVIATLTDGEENSSHLWTWDRLGARMGTLQAEGWDFVFVGVGIRDWQRHAQHISTRLHVPINNTYGGQRVNASSATFSVSNYVNATRSGVSSASIGTSWQIKPEGTKGN